MKAILNITSQELPWEKLPHNPPVAVTPKVHLIAWYTSGYE